MALGGHVKPNETCNIKRTLGQNVNEDKACPTQPRCTAHARQALGPLYQHPIYAPMLTHDHDDQSASILFTKKNLLQS